MYEIMYDTSGAFNNGAYYKDGKQPLVYAMGDGYVFSLFLILEHFFPSYFFMSIPGLLT